MRCIWVFDPACFGSCWETAKRTSGNIETYNWKLHFNNSETNNSDDDNFNDINKKTTMAVKTTATRACFFPFFCFFVLPFIPSFVCSFVFSFNFSL